ncbi:hypothetical protein GHL01_00510 [Sinorhizobium meliloti]|uniref:PcfJ domain-containing protein n=1 Tax=Rhizobium meliloti TaxID=382 RepID=UPI0012960A0B|nr:PcfJ domain-containing protein [Sinorhizobium meliloti]MQV12227.1 hypothetical protein [Sinorhizobium meliloti]
MDFTDDERIGQKVLLAELDAEPMRMVNPWMPEYINVSIGRLFISWSRQLDRDIAAGARPPLPSRDLGRFEDIMQKWIARADAFLGEYQYELVEVLDWLLLAGAERHPWLYNVDERNRPRKLMKCRTVDALYNESVKCMRGRQPQRKTEHDLSDTDERYVADLGLGYAVFELLSPDALDVEGSRMRHCVGNGTYDSKLGTPGYGLYSIRDAHGTPHATVELVPKFDDGEVTTVVRQFLGPRNGAPAPHLVELFHAVREDLSWHDTPAALPAPTPRVGRF